MVMGLGDVVVVGVEGVFEVVDGCEVFFFVFEEFHEFDGGV